MKSLAIPLLAALTLGAPATAGAASATAVRLTGLDLATSADAAVIARRLDRAAADVCGAARGSSRTMQMAVRRSDCYRETLEQALSSLNAPAVSAAIRDRAVAAAGDS